MPHQLFQLLLCAAMVSAPTPNISDFNTLTEIPVDVSSSRSNIANDQPSPILSGQHQNLINKSNNSPPKKRVQAMDQFSSNPGKKYSTPHKTPKPQLFTKPDGVKPRGSTPHRYFAKPSGGKRDKVKAAIRNNWLYYLQKLSRKILSMITTNAAAGNKWKIVNFDRIANITSIDIPNNISSPGAFFQSILNSPGDGGDMESLLDQIVSLAPIGPLVHRAEMDLDFNLEQVVDLFFVSPRQSTIRLSSTGPGEVRHILASSNINANLNTYQAATDPLGQFLVDRPPTKVRSYIQEDLTGKSTELQTQIFREAFSFWLSATLRRIHPFESQSWLSLCPFQAGKPHLIRTLTPCVVIFTNNKKEHIQSIITYNLPLQ
ncbi:hypothetical protein PtB15_11B676 [Puccinia triticina]|nr:hypothetical protein PtB15_11B676 [Puccinia triticina]